MSKELQQGNKNDEDIKEYSIHIKMFLEQFCAGVALILLGLYFMFYDKFDEKTTAVFSCVILLVMIAYSIYLYFISPKLKYETDDELSIRDMNRAIVISINIIGFIILILSAIFIINDIYTHWFGSIKFGWEFVLFGAGTFEILSFVVFEIIGRKSDF